MTKKDIIEVVAAKTGQKRNLTKKIIEHILEVFIDQLSVEGRIEVRNFGVFKVRKTPARIGRNPKTREVAAVPARRIVQFKAGKRMRHLVNGSRTTKVETPVAFTIGMAAQESQ